MLVCLRCSRIVPRSSWWVGLFSQFVRNSLLPACHYVLVSPSSRFAFSHLLLLLMTDSPFSLLNGQSFLIETKKHRPTIHNSRSKTTKRKVIALVDQKVDFGMKVFQPLSRFSKSLVDFFFNFIVQF